MSAESWKSTTWEGNRTAQAREFMALTFREKLLEIERMGEVAAIFEARRVAAGLPIHGSQRDQLRADRHDGTRKESGIS